MIIGLSGGMGSGKSTAVKTLTKINEGNIALVKFAGALYDMQEMIYTRVGSVYERPQDFVKDRFLLQFLGTEWGRGKISETLWVDLWKKDAERAHALDFLVVSDDVRFDNEADAIHSLGGYVIKIHAPNTDNRDVVRAGAIVGHASEAGVSNNKIDYLIENTGTLEQFEQMVERVYGYIQARGDIPRGV